MLILLLLTLQARETVEVPGTKTTFELVALPAGKDLRPVRLGAREVTWGEYNLYAQSRTVDAVTRHLKKAHGITS